MRFHCLQHVPFETPGLLTQWIGRRGYALETSFLFEEGVSQGEGDSSRTAGASSRAAGALRDEHRLPGVHDFDVLIIMGGPMSVHDEAEFPWLGAEKDLIAAAIRDGKKVLGICLGAQLIAEVMGGRIYPNPEKEIGFWPVVWTDEARGVFSGVGPGGERGLGAGGEFFHWHGETFDLPPGAVLLASSAGCVNQAFLLGENVLGVQFHPEVTPGIIEAMIRYEGHELVEGRYIQDAGEMRRRVEGMRGRSGEGAGQGAEGVTGEGGVLDLLLSTFFK